MHDEARFPEDELEAYFADAVERLVAGDPFDKILEEIPRAYRAEIADDLAVVEATRQLGATAVPQPTPAARAHNKAQFLASAAQMRTEQGKAPAAATAATGAWWRRLRTQAVNTLDKLQLPAGILQPVLTTLAMIAVIGGTFGLYAAAQASVPGETPYQLKEWVRATQLALAPEEAKSEIKAEHEKRIVEEVQEAAKKATLKNLIIEEKSTLTYYSFDDPRHRIGQFLVAPRYQPDPSVEIYEDMTIEGELAPGVQVELTYRILPWQTQSVGKPLVQGVALVVVAPPLAAADDEKKLVCVAPVPNGWVHYTVTADDTLAEMSARSGIIVTQLMAANCLTSNKIIAGETLLAPASAIPAPNPVFRPAPTRRAPVFRPVVTSTPPPPTATADTLVPEGTVTTPEAGVTATTPEMAETPAGTATPDSTNTPDETAIPEGTVTPGETDSPPSQTPAPTDDPEATPQPTNTPEVTEAPTESPTESPTAEPTGEPTAEPTAAPTGEATSAPTDEPEPSTTPAPTDDPDVPPAPTEAPTDAPTSEPTAEPTSEPTAKPTSEPTAAPPTEPPTEPTAAPTDPPTAAPTSGPTTAPTAIPTNIPTTVPTAAPTNPPTAVPPTAVPPTAVPPTTAPPQPAPPQPNPPEPDPPTVEP